MSKERLKLEHEKAFQAAKDRYRQTGAGGVTLPNSDNVKVPEIPNRDPKDNISFKNGVVVIGGSNVKTTTRKNSGSIQVFDYDKRNDTD